MTTKKRSSEFHGVLLVDKPSGMTSHDVVDRVRKIFNTRRVGHTGTLDPQATGLLVVLLGEATKVSDCLMSVDKSYEGTIKFGVVTNTYDADGQEEEGPGGALPKNLEDIQDAANELTGEIQQTPPPFSAKKVGGKKLYEYARKGQKPKVKPREVSVMDFEIISYKDGVAEFGVDCSSGTYVRSLAHELGIALGCGAILTELNRTDVGNFRLEDAWLLPDLEKLEGKRELMKALMPIGQALSDFPTYYLMNNAERWLRNGQAIPFNMVHNDDEIHPARGSRVLLSRLNGDAVALARVDPASTSPPPRVMANAVPPWFQPVKQFEIPEDHADQDDLEDYGEEE